MTILIAIACLLGGLIAGLLAARVFDALSPGTAIVVGVVTGVTLAAVALLFIGAAGAGAALIGGIAGSIAYSLLVASALGGC